MTTTAVDSVVCRGEMRALRRRTLCRSTRSIEAVSDRLENRPKRFLFTIDEADGFQLKTGMLVVVALVVGNQPTILWRRLMPKHGSTLLTKHAHRGEHRKEVHFNPRSIVFQAALHNSNAVLFTLFPIPFVLGPTNSLKSDHVFPSTPKKKKKSQMKTKSKRHDLTCNCHLNSNVKKKREKVARNRDHVSWRNRRWSHASRRWLIPARHMPSSVSRLRVSQERGRVLNSFSLYLFLRLTSFAVFVCARA